jgi:hypothetical protein
MQHHGQRRLPQKQGRDERLRRGFLQQSDPLQNRLQQALLREDREEILNGSGHRPEAAVLLAETRPGLLETELGHWGYCEEP